MHKQTKAYKKWKEHATLDFPHAHADLSELHVSQHQPQHNTPRQLSPPPRTLTALAIDHADILIACPGLAHISLASVVLVLFCSFGRSLVCACIDSHAQRQCVCIAVVGDGAEAIC